MIKQQIQWQSQRLIFFQCMYYSLISKILSQLSEMMKMSQHQVEHSYYSNMSTILKLSLKCLVAFVLTDNVYFVEIR